MWLSQIVGRKLPMQWSGALGLAGVTLLSLSMVGSSPLPPFSADQQPRR